MAEEKIGELFNTEPPKITPNENIGDIDFGNMGTAAAAPIAEAFDGEETSEDEAEMPEEELDENDPFNDDNLEEPEAIEESEDYMDAEPVEEESLNDFDIEQSEETVTEDFGLDDEPSKIEEEKVEPEEDNNSDLNIDIFSNESKPENADEVEESIVEETEATPETVEEAGDFGFGMFTETTEEPIEEVKEKVEEKVVEEKPVEKEPAEFSMFTDDSDVVVEEKPEKKPAAKTTKKSTTKKTTTKKTTRKKTE